MKLCILFLSGLMFMAAGCGADRTNIENVKVNANVTETVAANDNIDLPEAPADEGVLLLSESGKSESYPCSGREVEVEEPVTGSKFTLTGECKKLKVDGVSNKVFVEKVGEIEVIGTSNKVYYGQGLDGKEPKITKTGTSLIVEKKKDEADK